MELDQSKPKYVGTLRHYIYGMGFYLTQERKNDLETVLATFEITKYRLSFEPHLKSFISFRRKRDAMLFKLTWIECEAPDVIDLGLKKVILPVIRRVMPSVIAHDIIGVSPMTGPVNSIASLRARYADSQNQVQIQSQSQKRETMQQILDNTKAMLLGANPAASTTPPSSKNVRSDERRESDPDRTSE